MVDDSPFKCQQEDRAGPRSRQKQLIVVGKSKIVTPEAGPNGVDQRATGVPKFDRGIFARRNKEFAIGRILKTLNLGYVTRLHRELNRGGRGGDSRWSGSLGQHRCSKNKQGKQPYTCGPLLMLQKFQCFHSAS